MKNYRTLHGKKVRGRDNDLSEKELTEKFSRAFARAKNDPEIKEIIGGWKGRNIRIDLMGTPEVSFFLKIDNGQMELSSDREKADMAIGISREYFAKLAEAQPTVGNLKKNLFDYVSIRGGRVREFKALKRLGMFLVK